MPGHIQAGECPKVNSLVAPAFAEIHGRIDQILACAFAADLILCYEPPQVSPFPVCVQPIDRNRSMHLAIVDGKPEAITSSIVPGAELCQLSRDLGFKWQPKANQFAVVPGVQLADAPDAPWHVAFFN